MVRVEVLDCLKNPDARMDRAIRLTVADVDLRTLADLVSVFLKSGFEAERSEVNPRQLEGIQGVDESRRIDPRSPKDLKGPRGAAPFGNIAPLE